jgi:DNA polymerase III sliding clamp (beta) subunit (PCNA family)
VLCPPSRIFGSREIAEFGDSVTLGTTDKHVCFQVGNVTFWLKPIDARFPDVNRLIENTGNPTWLHLDRNDAEFMVKRLDDMPGKKQDCSPVYLSLNGTVAVRGYDKTPPSATELRLSHSRYEGEPITLAMNRMFLKQAIAFGIHRIGLSPAEEKHSPPFIGRDDSLLTYLWMPVTNDDAVCDTVKPTILESDPKALAAIRAAKPVDKAKPKAEKSLALFQ